MSNQIVPGSLSAIATANGRSIAETFVGADAVVIFDSSGSMTCRDSRGGRERYAVACEELEDIQRTLPGKIALLSFSDRTEFCPSGIPRFFGAGTDLAGALRFAKIADLPGMRFIIISDGDPDDRDDALRVAASYTNRIDVVYVGPEDRPSGRDFLTKLAEYSGGKAVTADRAKELASSVTKLLTGGTVYV